MHVLCDRHERLLVDPRVAGLVEGQDSDAEARVLLDDLVRLLVGVEGVHEDERDVGVVLLVQGLDLLHRQVKEGQVVAHRDNRFRALERKDMFSPKNKTKKNFNFCLATHGCSEASVELDHHQLLQHLLDLCVGRGREALVRSDLREGKIMVIFIHISKRFF